MYPILFTETGVDVSQADEILILFGLDNLLRPICTYICHYDQPYDRATLSEQFEPRSPEAMRVSPQIYHISKLDGISAAMPDEHTLLLGPEGELRGMMLSSDASNPLNKPLREINPSDVLCLMCDMAQIQAMSLLASDLELLPPGWEEFAKIPTLISALNMRLRCGDNPRFEVVVHTDSENMAELSRLGRRAIERAQQQLDAELTALGNGATLADRVEPSYLKRLLSLIPAALQIHQGSDRLVIAVRTETLFATGISFLIAADASWPSSADAQRWAISEFNLRSIGTALKAYYEINQSLPVPRPGGDGKQLLSWRVHLLPFLGEQALYEEFHFDEPWDSEHNRRLIARMPAVYRCPEIEGEGKTAYLAVANGAFSPDIRIALEDTDKNADSILVVESNRSRAAIWTSPSDFDFNPDDIFAGLGGSHTNSFAVLTAGGVVNRVGFSTGADEVRRRFKAEPAAASHSAD